MGISIRKDKMQYVELLRESGCEESVLALWNSPVSMVLANTLQDVPSHLQYLHNGEDLDWGGKAQLLPDKAYRRYYVADTNAALAVRLVTQTRKICGAYFGSTEKVKFDEYSMNKCKNMVWYGRISCI